jgi:hypothetical protein
VPQCLAGLAVPRYLAMAQCLAVPRYLAMARCLAVPRYLAMARCLTVPINSTRTGADRHALTHHRGAGADFGALKLRAIAVGVLRVSAL